MSPLFIAKSVLSPQSVTLIDPDESPTSKFLNFPSVLSDFLMNFLISWSLTTTPLIATSVCSVKSPIGVNSCSISGTSYSPLIILPSQWDSEISDIPSLLVLSRDCAARILTVSPSSNFKFSINSTFLFHNVYEILPVASCNSRDATLPSLPFFS